MNPNERRNPLEDNFERKEQEAETSKYADELSQKSFYESARLEFVVSGIASYGANFVSILTAVSFALFMLFDMLPDFFPEILRYTLAGGIAISALSLLEVVKRANTTAFFRNRYTIRKVPIKNRFSLVIFSLFSVIISVLGASDLARLATDKTELLQDTRAGGIAQIQAIADNQLQELEGKIKTLEATMDKQIADGTFFTYTEAVTENIAGKRSEQKQIREDAAAKIKEVELSFSGDSATNEDKSAKALYFMLGLSALAELLAILCLWFRVFYKYKVTSQSGYTFANTEQTRKAKTFTPKEKREEKREEKRTPNVSETFAKGVSSVFKHGSNTAEIIIETEAPKRMGVQKNGFKDRKPCKHCELDFVPRSSVQKFCKSKCKNDYHNSKKE